MSPLMQTFSLSSFWSGNPVRCTIYKCLLLLSKRVDGTPSLTFAHWVKVDIIVVATVFSPYLNSAFSSFFLASFPSVAPSLISELRAEKIEQKSITLVWREPSHPNSSRTGYEVKYYEKVYVLLLHHKYQLNSVLFVEEGGKNTSFTEESGKTPAESCSGRLAIYFHHVGWRKSKHERRAQRHGKQYNNKCPAGLLGQ